MLECELDYEATHCLFSNAPLIEAMCRFKRLGGKVLLVSDMYLHQEHIRVLLSKVAPNSLPHIDNIYSSADTVISKRSGLLFPRLAQMGAFPLRDPAYWRLILLRHSESPRSRHERPVSSNFSP